MSLSDPTYIGRVASVVGATVRVRLRDDMPSTLLLVGGESYRVGQIGSFVRLPIGYTDIYAVCTQTGADAIPANIAGAISEGPLADEAVDRELTGYRWMTVMLFGEALGGEFERGVSQYPTVGDEVHIVTNSDARIIYGSTQDAQRGISVGTIAGTSNISADVDIAGLVSRHSAIVGSTGAGKSNLVSVLLEAIADSSLPRARALVIDPHGEYGAALGDHARVFRVGPERNEGEQSLCVPFWALPFRELQMLTLGELPPNHEVAVRDTVLDMKIRASRFLKAPPPIEALTADSPIPFSIETLWYDLDSFERRTFSQSNSQSDDSAYERKRRGDPKTLTSDVYPAASPYNKPPYFNRKKRNIERHLDLMRSRLRDNRYSFLFTPGDGFSPDPDGKVQADLDALVAAWVGHDRPITILDVSGVPSQVLPTIVGTVLRIVYDVLFWAQNLPMGGREQPLLIVLDEAHLFVPREKDSPAHRTVSMIAKEGRKYGTGLMLVTQRPSEIARAALSQCGSIVALRTTNGADRGIVGASLPDELGGLVQQLPSLRTGEGLFVGALMPIPSRVRIRRARYKPVGDDPKLPKVWQTGTRPEPHLYAAAVAGWRAQTVPGVEPHVAKQERKQSQ